MRVRPIQSREVQGVGERFSRLLRQPIFRSKELQRLQRNLFTVSNDDITRLIGLWFVTHYYRAKHSGISVVLFLHNPLDQLTRVLGPDLQTTLAGFKFMSRPATPAA